MKTAAITNTGNSQRDYRIKLAILTSMLSKVATIAVQIVAIPIAINALGSERFGVFVMITALLSWLNLASAGLFPSLTREISRTKFNNKRVASLFAVVFYLVGAISITCGLGAAAILYLVPVQNLFGDGFELYASEIRLGGYVAISIVVLQIISSVAEAARAGFQEQHINNLWGVMGGITSLIALVTTMLYIPSLVAIILAVHGAAAIAKVANMTQMIGFHRRYLFPHPSSWDRSVVQVLVSSSSAFLLVQIASIASQQASAFIVGYIRGPDEVAVFYIMLQMIVLLGGTVVMFTQPVWPAITDAIQQKDHAWAKQRAKLLLWGLCFYALLIAILIAVFGETIIHFWIGPEITPSSTLLTLTGVYFFVVVWNHVNYMLLIGLGQTWLPATVLLTEAILMLVLCLYLVPKYGAEGGMLALVAAGIVITAWIAPINVKRTFTRKQIQD